MTPRRVTTLIILAILVIGAASLLMARSNWLALKLAPQRAALPSDAPRSFSRAADPVIYYRDPDGRPAYASAPKKTLDGKNYRPVHASEDTSFDDTPSSVASAAPAASGEGRRVRFYRNPMGLPDTSPVPKKDAMGMDYIPVYEDETQESSTITISPGKLQKTGVRSERVERRTLKVPVRAAGRIEFDPSRISVVSLRFEGFIESVENVAAGDYVHKGQPLMHIYSPSLSSAAAEYLAVLNAERKDKSNASRLNGARRRLYNLGAPESVIAAIERTRAVPRLATWPAPQDGHILERAAFNGMRAAPGDVLFRVVDHSVVWVLADIAERDISLVAPHQAVSVRPRAYPDRLLSGQVAVIYPHLNMETRTARVRIELPNPKGLLRGDMYADVEIAAGGDENILTVPDSAIIDTGKRQIVIIDKGDGRFEPREVETGRRGEGFVEVRKGLDGNDRVVTTANFLIDAESNLKAALKALDRPEEAK
jgi:Cu(I)/Ag(I) efflux system membrane fusion protein